LTQLFVSAQFHLTNLEQIKDRIQIEMFNESQLKFNRQKSFDSNVVGKIVKQNIELYFLENIEKMHKLDFGSKIEPADCFSIKPFKSNSLLLLYTEENILNLQCLDTDGNTLFERKGLIKNKKIEEIKFFLLRSSHKTVFIGTEEKHLNQTNTFHNLRSFDENFNPLAKLKLDKQPNHYDVNGKNLFLLDKHENFCTISMYNHNLEIIHKFGQENSTLPFHFSPPEIDHFLVSNQYFVFNEIIYEDDDDEEDDDDGDEDDDEDEDENYNSVTIINRSNGLVEASFTIYERFDHIKLYLDKFLLAFNNKSCLLQCYNFKGDLLGEITLDEKFEGSEIIVINKELCFVLDDAIIFIV